MEKEEKFEEAIELLESAAYNVENMKRCGVPLHSLVKEQIENAIKYLKDEEATVM